MLAEYGVQYRIDVLSTPAIEAINNFKTALASLNKASKPLTDLQRQVRSVNDALAGLKKQQIQLNTAHAKEQLTELLTLARKLKTTLASTSIDSTRSTRASRTSGSNQTVVAGGHTGHMPLTPKSSVGWLPDSHPASPLFGKYGNLSPTDQKRVDGMVRRANKARYKATKAINDADEKRYQQTLRNYRDATNRELRDAHNATHTPSNSAFRKEQWLQKHKPLQSARGKYLLAHRDEIYKRFGITPDMRYAHIGPEPDGKYYPASSTTSKWKPSKASNAYGSRQYTPRQFWDSQPKNLGYKLLGPTPLPNNGGMAVDILKGMGVAYGIAGIGALFSNIISQSTEYDNTMKTVENILKSHDKKGGFNSRFSAMSNTVRNVGMETKYTVTEVADAAKFLAMAGLGTDAINQSIRPIADIALVGDTELGETADLVTNIMTAYNIAPNKMRRAADVMTNTFTMSNTTLTEIAEAYKYSAALLSAGGVDFEESAAAIGVLGDAGIKGSQAGTTMRTLLANILNPTKKQAGAWSEIGISTKGKSLVQIFQQLHDKNVTVDQFYRLFHKTAAQGAVALADHVDKWNEVIVENFMSDGLSARLADEKKNTLQGLWAQLKSVFTDDGVTAFGGIQGGIRSMMKSAIDWLKTDSVQNKINELFKTFAEFGKIIIDSTKKFYSFFKLCEPLILGWMKFQLIIWPVVKGLTAFKSVILSLQAVKGLAGGISALSASFMGLKNATTAFSASNGAGVIGSMTKTSFVKGPKWGYVPKQQLYSIYSGPMGSLPGVTHAQKIKAERGLNLRRPHAMYADKGSPLEAEANAWNAAALAQYKRDKIKYNRRLVGAQIRNSLKPVGASLTGAGLMGLGGYEFTREDANSKDMWAGGFYSVASIAAMTNNPVGWTVAGIAALAGALFQVAGHFERVKQIVNGFAQFANSNQIINGVMIDSSDKTMRYLEFVYAKNNDINGLINRRIELTKELLGLENPKNNDYSSSGVYDKTRKDLLDLGWSDRRKSASYILSQWDSKNEIGVNDNMPVYKLGDGTELRYKNSYGHIDKAFSNDLAAANELMNGGYYSGLLADMHNQVTRRLLLGTSKDDWNSYWNNYYLENDPSKISGLIRPDEFNETKFELENWTKDRKLKSYFARNEVYQNLEKIAAPMRNAINQFLSEKESGQYTESGIVDLLHYAYGGLPSQYMGDFNSKNAKAWFEHFGYWDNTFHEYKGNDANTMAQIAIKATQDIQEALTKLGLAGEPAAQSLMNFSSTLMAQAEAFLGTGDAIVGAFDGQVKKFGDLTLQWDASKQVWKQLVDDNALYMTSLSSNLNWFNSSIFGLGSTLGGYDWNSMWNNLLPKFNTTSFSGWSLGGGFNYAGSTLGSSDSFSFTPPFLGTPNVSYTEDVKNWLAHSGAGFKFRNPLQKYPAFGNVQMNQTPVEWTPEQVGNISAYKSQGKGKTGPDDDADDQTEITLTPEIDTEQYKSRYQNNSAAPKQVLVNISNLMNVESVDLSNPDNKEVINNLKEQLTQALVDVVHDFDETWHG